MNMHAWNYTKPPHHTPLETRIRLVETGKSKVFEDWNKKGGITKEAFIEGLKWLDEDPYDPIRKIGRLERELTVVHAPYEPGVAASEMDENGNDIFPLHCVLKKMYRSYYPDGLLECFYAPGEGSLFRIYAHINKGSRI